MAGRRDIGPDVARDGLALARIGTVGSSPCRRSAARTWTSISSWSGCDAVAQTLEVGDQGGVVGAHRLGRNARSTFRQDHRVLAPGA